MTIPITANPYSNLIVAPEHEVSSAVYYYLVYWVDEAGNYITDEAGNNIVFKRGGSTVYPYTIEANPYSNVIVAPEKPNG